MVRKGAHHQGLGFALDISVGFEIVEVSLQHVLPNFNECWWDHPGHCVGQFHRLLRRHVLVRLLEGKHFRYKWTGSASSKDYHEFHALLLRGRAMEAFDDPVHLLAASTCCIAMLLLKLLFHQAPPDSIVKSHARRFALH